MAKKRTDGRTDGRDGRTEHEPCHKLPSIGQGGERGVMAPSIAEGTSPDLRAPFPWFGGKSRAAHLIWPRFGNVHNYIEPFAGSLAVLLKRPHPPRVETVNDKDCYLANFWRALQWDSDAVAYWADWPVNEADLHATHRWLVTRGRRLALRVSRDPHYFNAKIAGLWVRGQCLWIGSGWCARPEWTGRTNAGRAARGIYTDEHQNRPDLSSSKGRGAVGGALWNQKPYLKSESQGVIGSANWKKRPNISDSRGVHSVSIPQKRPMATGNGQGSGVHRRWNSGGAGAGQGVYAPRLAHQVPQLSGDQSGSGRCLYSEGVRTQGLYEYLFDLAARLRRVRVCCGEWRRVLTPAVTTYIGQTAVLLDPPYDQEERSICYSHDENISVEVRAWALEHGDDPQFRIALCGYESEHAEHMPPRWECVRWKAGGGYGRSDRGRANRHRERIWFSPYCLKDRPPLFANCEEVPA